MKRGDIVIDKEADDTDHVVILTPDATLTDWYVDKQKDLTVAHQNPDYENDQKVVVTAIIDMLEEQFPEWKETESTELFDEITDRGIKFYAFPKKRLKRHGLNQDYESPRKYAEVVLRNKKHYTKEESWMLENAVQIGEYEIIAVKADKSTVTMIQEDNKKIKIDVFDASAPCQMVK